MKKKQNERVKIWNTTKEMNQSELAKLIGVNRSSVCRRAPDMAKTQSGKILIHEPASLSIISEIMDNYIDDLNYNDPNTDEYMIFYNTVAEEARAAFMAQYYCGGARR